MKLFNHVLEIDTRSRQPWNHFRVHRYGMHKHIVWGKFSIIVGQPHLEEITVCSNCDEEIRTLTSGDEIWNYCEPCQQVEGDTETITIEEFEKRANQ